MKIGIIGSGLVGSTTAYALVMQGVGREIVLVDKFFDRAAAEANDITHAIPFAHSLNVFAGNYSDLFGCKVVVLAAGVNQKPGESRLELLGRNAEIFKEIIPQVVKYAKEAVFLVATNPVDIMTHLTYSVARELDVPINRILGSGTTLDTARFRSQIGNLVGIDSHHVHAYVVGEHGDSEVLAWSSAKIGGILLEEFCKNEKIALSDDIRKNIDNFVRNAAYHIIKGKGATYYGIGSALARIIKVILYNHRAILTVCKPQNSVIGVENVTVSLPQLVSGEGIISALSLPLNTQEKKELKNSAGIVKKVLDDLQIS